MCGIFGCVTHTESVFTPQQLAQIATKLFLLSESRGKEASGFAAIVEDDIIVHKTPFPAARLVKSTIFRTVFRQLFDASNQVQAFIGHSRLVTDGYEHENRNNQPVIKHALTAVHNGIIVNKRALWERYSHETRDTELDSELIPVILHDEFVKDRTERNAFQCLFENIYGMTNIALLSSGHHNLFLASNNGSLYYLYDHDSTCFVFASERYILRQVINTLALRAHFHEDSITQLRPLTALCVSFSDLSLSLREIGKQGQNFKNITPLLPPRNICEKTLAVKNVFVNTSLEHEEFSPPQELADEYFRRREQVRSLRRCTTCLLPETFPFIEFDAHGECNYCRHYQPIQYKGLDAFRHAIEPFRKALYEHDCLMPFSGGRDSSYALHVAVRELGLKPLAYSYDWGMLTDLGRRNQARMCGRLGVEHILVSANIRRKRKNIRKNVSAWLKRPNLGTIPLFMAGDKQYFYFANVLMEQNGLKLSILGENMLETTRFKSGFCRIPPIFEAEHTYSLSAKNKLKMFAFYGKEFLLNPAFINSSLFDTLDAFRSYYVIQHQNINLFDYVRWEENEIEQTLIQEYDWETDPGTATTWRIGDGTVAFYNYIYYMVAGFTEHDTFRSNQIREGMLDRENALEQVNTENRPRYDSIKWYLDTIGLEFDATIQRINQIPQLYQS